MVVEGGIKLHLETVKELLDGSLRRRQRLMWSIWFATMVVLSVLVLAVR
jgi:ubiquinone biosynthesis protein